MIGEDVIGQARKWLAAFYKQRPNWPTTLGDGAARLLEQLAWACEAENARRKLLAEARGTEAKPSEDELAAVAKIRQGAEHGGGRYLLQQVFGDECVRVVRYIERLESRVAGMELMLMDAEDALRSRIEGRRAGRAEALMLAMRGKRPQYGRNWHRARKDKQEHPEDLPPALFGMLWGGELLEPEDPAGWTERRYSSYADALFALGAAVSSLADSREWPPPEEESP